LPRDLAAITPLTRAALTAVSLTALAPAQPPRADDLPARYQGVIDKGLEYLSRKQNPDGSWAANGGQYPTSMTALAGMALVMEGSTIRDGKYARPIRKAVDWLMERAQRDTGMIGNPRNPSEASRYMYGHGFGLLFLSSVYGEEEDGDRRKRLHDILTRAVDFTGKAQTNRGGWGYVSAADGSNFDEGSVTITQVQALRAAKNAGIAVPRSIIDKAHDYLKNSTTERGGVVYSLAQGHAMGGERPPLTAAAIACMFSSGEYTSPLAKRWLKFCQTHIPLAQGNRFGHDEYTHYYWGQALYILGDDGYAKLFPDSREDNRLTWSKYRKGMFDHLVRSQNAEGYWTGGYIGPIFTTAVYLTILQLDNGTLPIYQK
jgi:hypothetical protein